MATHCEVRYGVIVESFDCWSPESFAQCEADDPGSYDEWVTGQLDVVMRAAGDAWIAAHPDLVRGRLV